MFRLLSFFLWVAFIAAPLAAKNAKNLINPKITASSQFNGFTKPWLYPPYHLFDDNSMTVWCEGAKNHNGTGQYIDILLKEAVKVNAIRIRNGFSRDPKIAGLNWQVKSLQVMSLKRKTGAKKVSVTLNIKPVSFKSKAAQYENYKLTSELKGRRFRLVIQDVYANKKDKGKDVCLGDVQLGIKKGGWTWYKPKQTQWLQKQKQALAKQKKLYLSNSKKSKNPKLPHGKTWDVPASVMDDGKWSMMGIGGGGGPSYDLCHSGRVSHGYGTERSDTNTDYGTWQFKKGGLEFNFHSSVINIGVGKPEDGPRNVEYPAYRYRIIYRNKKGASDWQGDWSHKRPVEGNCSYALNHQIELKTVISDKSARSKMDKHGYTPLMWAAARGNTEVVRFLANKKSKINHKNQWGDSALLVAVDAGHKEIVGLLIRNGATISKNMVIHAALANKPTILIRLLKGGFPLHTKFDPLSGGKGKLTLKEYVKKYTKGKHRATILNAIKTFGAK